MISEQNADVKRRRRVDIARRVVVCAAGLLFLGAAPAFSGCKALEEHKCCLFSDEGLFGKRLRSNVETATKKDEQDAIARASIGRTNRKEAWDPTDEEIAAAAKAGVDLRDFVWSTQLPNGGALFPKSWQAPGPALVVAPDAISAPVGTDVIVVASYIGSDSEYLQTGERLSWDISGVGRIMETNPSETGAGGLFTNEYKGCFYNCPLLKKVRKVEAAETVTTTSNTLYRITRGTESPRDDVTILRGQSWVSATSDEEGTSSVVVMASDIASWDKRRAVARINWVDAAFKYPTSGIGTINSTTKLATKVVRRSTGEARQNWLVKYDVLGGDAALGPNRQRTLVVQTDEQGEAAVSLSQTSGTAGTAKIKATILRPETDRNGQIEIDSRTFFYTWTYSAPVTLTLHGPEQYVAGQDAHYQLIVNNLSDFAQRTVVELVLPDTDTRLVSCDTQWAQEAQDKTWIRWDLSGIPPHSKAPINFAVRRDPNPQKQTDPRAPLNLNALVVSSTPLGADGKSNAPATPQPAQAAPLTTTPPAESPSSSVPPSL